MPFFEFVLPPRAAKAAVPMLAFVSVAGVVALVAGVGRQPNRHNAHDTMHFSPRVRRPDMEVGMLAGITTGAESDRAGAKRVLD